MEGEGRNMVMLVDSLLQTMFGLQSGQNWHARGPTNRGMEWATGPRQKVVFSAVPCSRDQKNYKTDIWVIRFHTSSQKKMQNNEAELNNKICQWAEDRNLSTIFPVEDIFWQSRFDKWMVRYGPKMGRRPAYLSYVFCLHRSYRNAGKYVG